MISQSLLETEALAKKIATQSSKRIFALSGDLGSGKTTLIQFFLKALGVTEKITSPTFLIIKNYQLPITNNQFRKAYHIDCYRLKDPTELLNLDFKNIIKNEENLILIEWAEKVGELLPEGVVWIHFKHGPTEQERIINYENLLNN